MSKTLTVREIAEQLQICKPAAYQLVNSPGFPAIHVGRAIRIPEAAFQQWIEQQTGGKNGSN